MILKFSALGVQNLEIANQKLKPFVISVVKKCDEIFGLNEAKAYYTHLEKAHSDRYELRMREYSTRSTKLQKTLNISHLYELLTC